MLAGTIAALLRETVTIEPFAALDTHGRDTYGTAATAAARVEQKTQNVREEKTGNEVVSHAMIFLDGATTITNRSRITLPDSTKPQILAIDVQKGPDCQPYMKVVYV
jgi:hypothetical protein